MNTLGATRKASSAVSNVAFLIGPPGSGKSTQLLGTLREALTRHDPSVRLLVPSATMALHVRNQLAREGFLLRRQTVSTFSRFLNQLPLPLAAPSPALLGILLAQILLDDCPPEFKPLRDSLSFRRALLGTLEELSLAAVLPAQVPGALGKVYGALAASLASRQLGLRGDRLLAAKAWFEANRLPGLSHLLFDGFFTFAAAEAEFLEAIAAHCRVDVTLPTQEPAPLYRQPQIEVRHAATREAEVLSIAASIQELVSQGVPLRRIGVLLPKPAAYLPLLENAFARLAIPSRSYLGQDFSQHPFVAFVRDLIAAAQSGWEQSRVLTALRWNLTGLGGHPDGDALEWRVRQSLPASGLDSFPQLASLAPWPTASFAPLEAAQELRRTLALFAPPSCLSDEPILASRWNDFTTVTSTLDSLFTAAAAHFDPSTSISVFALWAAVEAEFDGLLLRERDRRREVVHLMDLHESRQWELDYVFAPGLIEGAFPSPPVPDPFLSDDLRNQFGMKTLQDREAEESLLWRVLRSRALIHLSLSYPRYNETGDPSLPSPFLEEAGAPWPRFDVARPQPAPAPLHGQVPSSYRPDRPWSATELETYLQCPWKHFAQYGLQLESLPKLPSERLDQLVLGSIAHDALKHWMEDPSRDLVCLGLLAFDAALLRHRIPPGYKPELERLNLTRHLRLFAKNPPLPPPGWTPYLEEKFSFQIEDGPIVRGQIDRYDLSPDGRARAYDYKYSRVAGLKEKYVQGGLYALALQHRPSVSTVESFSYVALREEAQLTTFSGPALEEILTRITEESKSIVQLVAQGQIQVLPLDRNNCPYCDFQDACRLRVLQLGEQEEEAEAAGQ